MENRGVWKWMEKELRTTKNRRVGMGSSWGHPLPETPRMHGFLCLPIPPTWFDEGTSGTYLCARQGLRLTHQVSFWGGGLSPSSAKVCFLCNILFGFLVLSWCVASASPAKFSWLQQLPRGVPCETSWPVLLRHSSCSTASGAEGARCVEPVPPLASPLPGTALCLLALGRDNPCHRALSMGLVSSFSYI